MNADFTFDQRKFTEDMERIRQLGGLSVAEVLSRASRIAVRQAILNTPYPRKGGALALGKQKDQQEQRIGRDVVGMFRLLSEVNLPNERVRQNIAKQLRGGNFEAALGIMENVGKRNAIGVLDSPSEEGHKKLRFREREKRYFVMPDESKSAREAFIKSVQKRVFTMKAGWGRAAMGLKLKVPASLKRHFPGQGGFKANLQGDKPSIEFENRAKGLGETREPDYIIANAMKSAATRIAKELQIYMASVGRGDWNKVRSKLQKERFTATEVA